MDEKLKTTIEKIVQLSKQNPEFDTELRKRLDINSSGGGTLNNSIPENISAIRSALEIRGDQSINYDFVVEGRLHDQLQIDNLRMENASLNLTEKEETRFYAFCVNAFYQMENIINYYYYKKFPDIDNLLSEIEIMTAGEKSNEADYSFTRSNRERTVADIPIADKINAFCNTFFPGDNIKLTISSLRRVRNEGEHRCDVIIKEKNEKESLYRFFKYNNFNSIRILLIKLVSEIKTQITTVSTPQKELCKIIKMLPSACFVSIQGKNVQLPHSLFKFVKGKKEGDMVEVTISKDVIINVSL